MNPEFSLRITKLLPEIQKKLNIDEYFSFIKLQQRYRKIKKIKEQMNVKLA